MPESTAGDGDSAGDALALDYVSQMLADASSLAATRRQSCEGPSAKGLGPTPRNLLHRALGPRRLARPKQRKGVAVQHRTLVDL